jgi:hypothetical protein
LIRDPFEMLCSLVRQIPEPRLEDTGLAVQMDLVEELKARGQDLPVLDARQLLLDPRAVLELLCGRLGLAFEEAMLSWSDGGRPEDGVWAPYWYRNVHRSTGFQPYRPKEEALPERLRPLLEECRPLYDRLYRMAIRAQPTGRGSRVSRDRTTSDSGRVGTEP